MTENPPPRLSVIIPHYNDLERLDACLQAVTQQSLPRDSYEIIVSDNMSPVGEDAVRAAISDRARLVIASERGAGPARNRGVEEAKGAILAFTDCDCLPRPDWLEQGLKALDAADFVGGRMTVLVRPGKAMNGTEAFEAVFAFDNARYIREEFFTVTANLFCPKPLFEKIGPFRTMVAEDKEWCLRAKAAGYRIGYAERAVVGHPAREDWPQLRQKWGRMMAESYALARERGQGGGRWLLRTWLLPFSIPVHAIKMLRSPAVTGLKSRIAGVIILARCRLWRFAEGHRLLFRQKADQ